MCKKFVLGTGSVGLTTALSAGRKLHGDIDVTVMSPTASSLFTAGLPWIPCRKSRHGYVHLP